MMKIFEEKKNCIGLLYQKSWSIGSICPQPCLFIYLFILQNVSILWDSALFSISLSQYYVYLLQQNFFTYKLNLSDSFQHFRLP